MKKKTLLNIKKNDVFPATVTAYTSEGLGICRIDDTVVFVPETAIGDELEVRITKTMPTFAYGRKERLISASRDRVTNDCPAFPRCGGCDFRHISYEAELEFKKQRVSDVLHRITGIDLEPEEILGADNTLYYRNKAQFPVQDIKGKPQLGFYRERSHDIIPIEKCMIQDESTAQAMQALTAWMERYSIPAYDEITHNGIIRHLYTRTSKKTGESLICIVTYTERLPHKRELVNFLLNACPNAVGILQCVNSIHGNKILSDRFVTLHGKDYVYDYIGDLRFKISAQSFFQINTEQAYKLYSKAKEFAGLTGKEDVIDLYCGTGTVGLFMADKAKSLHGVEIIPEAIEDAKINAQLNGINNASFVADDATGFAPKSMGLDNNNTVIFVDPPRKGLTDGLITNITDFAPSKVVYISCDPATMARDLKTFISNGYLPTRCTAVDMFPRTRHVETVVLLSQLKSTDHIKVEIDLSDDDLTPSEAMGTYDDIKKHIYERYQVKVSSLYISQVKRKLGLPVGECYNKPKNEDARVPNCPEEKEKLIVEALRHFKMI